ncbi:MAG: N-acetylneuraminate synthase family protein [Ilumatobacteraceae bacterium]
MSDRPLIVAEVGQAHDGSLGTAHAFIDAVANAGADFVKFQTHIADAESHPSEPWRVKFSRQDATRFDYWKRMEFLPNQWQELYEHARERNLGFMSSPFSLAAVDQLRETGIDMWKIASGEVNHESLLTKIADDGRPVAVSSGMSTLSELDRAVEILGDSPRNYVLQCTTAYPCPPERLGLNLLAEFKQRFNCRVGLSDHSGTTYAGLAAVALGAQMLEVHVTMSRAAFGPDVSSSLTFDELSDLCDGVDFIHRSLRQPADKSSVSDDLATMRGLFTRSIVTTRAVIAGAVLSAEDLTLKKPGSGMAPDMLPAVIGQTVRRDLPANHILEVDDFGSV